MIDKPVCVVCETDAAYNFSYCMWCRFRFCLHCYFRHDCPAIMVWERYYQKPLTWEFSVDVGKPRR